MKTRTRRRNLKILVLGLFLAGCGSQPEPYSFSGGNGSTREHAVIIKAPDEGLGVAAQMVWMKEKHSGWREITNRFELLNGRIFYEVEIAKDGKTNTVYFDYTDFFPKK